MEHVSWNMGMKRIIISGSGVSIPQATISNEELVESFNSWVERENGRQREAGLEPLPKSDADFIYRASGIKRRHVHTRDGILDIDRMAPRIPERDDDAVSVLAEFGAEAARSALEDAAIPAEQVDLVICASSHLQRLYPAIRDRKSVV